MLSKSLSNLNTYFYAPNVGRKIRDFLFIKTSWKIKDLYEIIYYLPNLDIVFSEIKLETVRQRKSKILYTAMSKKGCWLNSFGRFNSVWPDV